MTTEHNELHLRFSLQFGAADDKGFHLHLDERLPGAGVTAVYGPSGSGKTSLLRCIAGLERPANAYIRVHDAVWQDERRFVPSYRRSVGVVFQEASLFPHLSAADNLRFAEQRAHRQARQRGGIARQQAIDLLGIEAFLQRMPEQLSGGERQRIAIARALLIQPQLLLMDEPLAALDYARKQEILPYLEKLRAELQIPIIYISHAADEIARLADHLLALDQGQVIASGPLNACLSRLDSPIQLGEDTGVVLEANIAERDSQWQLARVEFEGGSLWVRDSGHALSTEVRVRVLARDVSLALDQPGQSSILNVLPATVDGIADADGGPRNSAISLVRVSVGGTALLSRLTRRSVAQLGLRPGARVWVQVKSAALLG